MSNSGDSVYNFDVVPTWDGFRSVFRKDHLTFYLGTTVAPKRLELWIQIAGLPAVAHREEELDSLRMSVFTTKDQLLDIRFELLDSVLERPFLSFCRDFKILLQYADDGANLLNLVLGRIKDWQELLKRRRGLSTKVIKGLLSELVYLRDVLAPKVGFDAAVRAWEGPFGGDQDFLTDQDWTEIKSTVSGNNHVTISSVEQLDTVAPGHLAVLTMDKANAKTPGAVTLPKVVNDIREGLKGATLEMCNRFEDALCVMGYDDAQGLDRYAFVVKDCRTYRVSSEDFPRIRQKDLPAGVDSVKYVLDLNVLEAFKED